jgi:hypothetical protein
MDIDVTALEMLPAEQDQAGLLDCWFTCLITCSQTCSVTGS